MRAPSAGWGEVGEPRSACDCEAKEGSGLTSLIELDDESLW
jgi:hypothetical protein